MSDFIYFGDAVKAVGDGGRVGGYLVLFTGPDNKDLDGEYFTKSTYYGAHTGDGVDTVFHHGRRLPVKGKIPAAQKARIDALSDHIFAPVKTRVDDVGIWAETVLNLADEYEAAVYSLVQAGKISWSSGAVSHLVKKDADGKITRWPIGEASLTPTPARPFSKVAELKSLDSIKLADILADAPAPPAIPDAIPDKPAALSAKLNQHIDDLADDGAARDAITAKMAREAGLSADAMARVLAGETPSSNANLKAFARVLDVDLDTLRDVAAHDRQQTIKGIYETALSERAATRWELESVYAGIIERLAKAALATSRAGAPYEYASKVREATGEYAGRLLDLALMQINQYVESGSDEPFYLKSVVHTEEDLRGLSSIDLDDHAQLAVSALRGFSARLRGNHAARVKVGRVLSDRNRSRISLLLDQLKAVGDDLQSLLDESTPMATDEEKRAAELETLRLRARTNKLGV